SITIQPSLPTDPFYSHQTTAKLGAHFVSHLFTCPDYAPSTMTPYVACAIPASNKLCRLRPPLHLATPHCDFCCSLPSPTAKILISHRSQIFWASTIHFSIRDCLEGHLRQRIPEQVVVHRGPRHVRFAEEINQTGSYLKWELNVEP
ncbi:hypothetical protein NEOLEDRAFT_1211561, partial [Neolentinus lepideus HHB14362 ss-1]